MFYPWQTQDWQTIIAQNAQSALAHGLLFGGPEGTGKQHFARELSHALLCITPAASGVACGACASCKLYQAGNHPDFHLVEPEETGKAISVDKIRELTAFLQMKTHFAGKKIALILHADAMNVSASNSLLKSLEEPPANSLLILVSNHTAKLLPTIRSRCQQRAFSVPSTEVALHWLREHLPAEQNPELLLALASGAPLLAVQFAHQNVCEARERCLVELETLRKKPAGIVKTAEAWAKKDVTQTLFWLTSFVIDMVRCKTTSTPAALANTDVKQRIQKIAEGCDYQGLTHYCRKLLHAKTQLTANANAELLIADLLIEWTELA